MKSILLSVQPQWCEKIANKQKTVEIRKTKPKIELPFKVFIYQSVGKTMFIDVLKDGDLIPYTEEIHIGKTEVLTCPKSLGVYGGKQKVIAEFICDEILQIDYNEDLKEYNRIDSSNGKYLACISMKEAKKYGKGKTLYAWHISDLVIYDKPKDLKDFYKYCGKNPNCGNCKYYYSESNESIGFYDECCSPLECYKPISKPPQSYCFVENL